MDDGLIREAALSDLWFAYCHFHSDSGNDLRATATDFMDTLEKIGVEIPFYWESVEHDEEWLILEYPKRL